MEYHLTKDIINWLQDHKDHNVVVEDEAVTCLDCDDACIMVEYK